MKCTYCDKKLKILKFLFTDKYPQIGKSEEGEVKFYFCSVECKEQWLLK